MKLKTDQRGVTLLEVLMAAGIAAMLASVCAASIFLFLGVTEQSNEQFRALHDIQNAGYWLSLDGRRAQATDLIDGAAPVGDLILNWTEDDQMNTVTYSLSDTRLQRDHNGNVTIVARHITNIGFSISQGLITSNITSSPDGRWAKREEATYQVCLRSTS
ncbi:MAG: type II secretion system protein [Chloroflexota bacterium]|nr:type II secretion system protein [Chloroflexota bacterium]